MRRVVFCAALMCTTISYSAEVEVESVLITVIDQVQVPVKESGVLESLRVREGQLVEAGDLLGTLNCDLEKLAQENASLELQTAELNAKNDVDLRLSRKSLELAKTELKRANESILVYPKSISQTEIDRLRLAAEQAELEAEKAEHGLSIAKLSRSLRENQLAVATLMLERRKIVAPLRGVVAEQFRKEGERLAAEAPVLRIVGLDRLRAEGFLNVRDTGLDLNGHAVRLNVELPGSRTRTFSGTIVFVSPEIEPVDGRFRIWAEIPNREGLLRPGMPASMKVDIGGPSTKAASQ